MSVKIFLNSTTKLQKVFGLCQKFKKLSYFCTVKIKEITKFTHFINEKNRNPRFCRTRSSQRAHGFLRQEGSFNLVRQKDYRHSNHYR